MISRHYARRRLPDVFPRTSGEAFRDAAWASAIERPTPTLWSRFRNFLRSL